MNDFKEFFNLYYRSLCIYAMHILNDTDIVEDIVMECYIKLWIRLKENTHINDVKNYLFITVRNACYDTNRKNNRAMDFIDTQQIEEDAIMLEVDEERIDRNACLWQIIDSLPQKCRKIFLMSKQEELSYNEIAARLGLSIKTVEAQISKAYKILRSKAKGIYFVIILLLTF